MLSGRDLSNLGKGKDATLALQAVSEMFGDAYLNAKKNHRLQKLWSRADRLATVELYTLGVCLIKLKKSSPGWLKSTIGRIKKQPPTSSQGFFTEILYSGMSSLHESEITPAEKSNSGYDFSVTLPNNTRQFVSVKNIDSSEQYIKFQKRCSNLRIKWIEKLRVSHARRGIRVVSTRVLLDEDFKALIGKIKSLNLNSHQNSLQIGAEIKIHIFDLPPSEYSLSSKYISDIVQVFCPPPESELKRYLKKIRDAVVNISKYTPQDEGNSRVIFIRTHVNADFDYISEEINKLVNEQSGGVDCIIFYQPSYVRDENNSSLLNHCFKFVSSPRYALKMNGADHFIMNIPVGYFSQNQSPVKIIDLESGQSTELPPSYYFFQKGDLYLQSKKDKDGSIYCNDLGSPALGIRKHGVFFDLVIEAKGTPKSEDLLII
ncbi:hypothetical protein [Bowmanella denitrificans]|uniref:hypothetical protein n=1 Tax=Bowmanella denitrificans TaxID=366582 RepID=UPI000C9A4F31|nr:hypothetical protein [Bowmanella denitrificans]